MPKPYNVVPQKQDIVREQCLPSDDQQVAKLPKWVLSPYKLPQFLIGVAGNINPMVVFDIIIRCIKTTEQVRQCQLLNETILVEKWKTDPSTFVDAYLRNDCGINTDGHYLTFLSTNVSVTDTSTCSLETIIQQNLQPYALVVAWYRMIKHHKNSVMVTESINTLLPHVNGNPDVVTF